MIRSDMAERRVSGWFVLSAVFLVAVFGLFFTFTERKTWPEQRIELAATDMRLAPQDSTIWCEAVALKSDHPFVAYQVTHPTEISPKHLNKQKVSMNMKLNGGSGRSSIKLKYYLLPTSVIEIYACATFEGASLLVFQGEEDVASYLEYLQNKDDSASSDSESMDESSEESASDSEQSYSHWHKNKCPSLVSHSEIHVSDYEGPDLNCLAVNFRRPLQVNITSMSFYVIAVLTTNRHRTNEISLRILLDRSRYTTQHSGMAFDMCSLATTCTIGLSFASKDRALVYIPEEPNAGRSTFVIRSQCKPRLAVFAILSVFFPLMAFLGVAFVMRADRDRLLRIYRGRTRSALDDNGQRPTADPRPPPDCMFATPLLDNTVVDRMDDFHVLDLPNSQQTNTDEMPPAYHTLYDSPPPYACVKEAEEK